MNLENIYKRENNNINKKITLFLIQYFLSFNVWKNKVIFSIYIVFWLSILEKYKIKTSFLCNGLRGAKLKYESSIN